jgi:hypothetical protein
MAVSFVMIFAGPVSFYPCPYIKQAHSVNYIPTCSSFSEPVAGRSARFVETKTVKELLDTAQVQRL